MRRVVGVTESLQNLYNELVLTILDRLAMVGRADAGVVHPRPVPRKAKKPVVVELRGRKLSSRTFEKSGCTFCSVAASTTSISSLRVWYEKWSMTF